MAITVNLRYFGTDGNARAFAEEDPDRDAICQDAGIRAVCISAPAADILKAIEEGNE